VAEGDKDPSRTERRSEEYSPDARRALQGTGLTVSGIVDGLDGFLQLRQAVPVEVQRLEQKRHE